MKFLAVIVGPPRNAFESSLIACFDAWLEPREDGLWEDRVLIDTVVTDNIRELLLFEHLPVSDMVTRHRKAKGQLGSLLVLPPPLAVL